MAGALTPIEILKRAANGLELLRRDVELNNGTIFSFWCRPLTMAERERAERASKGDNNNMALQLLVDKARTENGERMFIPAQMAELKNEVRDDDLQKLMVAVLTAGDNEAPLEPKSTAKAA